MIRGIIKDILKKKDKRCPGGKIRSKGRGKSLGTGRGKGPIDRKWSYKSLTQIYLVRKEPI